MRLPQSSSPRMAKSNSLGVIEHDHEDLHIVDQDDIIGLTQDVKNFSDGLANLKAVFNDQDSKTFVCIILPYGFCLILADVPNVLTYM